MLSRSCLIQLSLIEFHDLFVESIGQFDFEYWGIPFGHDFLLFLGLLIDLLSASILVQILDIAFSGVQIEKKSLLVE